MNELRPIQPLDNRQLSKRIKTALLAHLKASVAQDSRPIKLPKEEELARQLGVSRNGLRDVLIVLEEEGYISRRRSKGTIANPDVLKSTCRIDINTELSELIRTAGFTPRMDTLCVEERDNPPSSFGDQCKTYWRTDKIFFADGEPVSFVIDRIPDYVVAQADCDTELLRTMPHYDFLENHCGVSISCVLADIQPTMPDSKLAEILQLSPGVPILQLEGNAYNYDHEIIYNSTLYLVSGKLNYNILRKRL